MKPVVTAQEMRALDRTTIDELGLPALTLMETAGRAVAEAALRMLGADRGHVAVVCGPGNNGGDGFVAARVLRDRGIDAVVYLAAARDLVRDDARAHLEIFERAGGTVRMLATPEQLAALDARVIDAALVIDALFGVGLSRPVEEHLAQVIAMMLMADRVLAVDVPSGVDSDTGRVLGTAVIAERTITMSVLKLALVSAPGFARAGEVEVVDIGIPATLIAATPAGAGVVEASDVARWLPHPQALEHKGRRGHVLVVGGSPGMRGAGRLAAAAALRAGAGLCTLAAEGELDAPDSVMTRSLSASGGIASLLAGKAAVVIGPGLGSTPAAAARVSEVLSGRVPAVLDADALNLLAPDAGSIARAAGPIVVTPHPGEAARLLGVTVAVVESDRLAAARALAGMLRAVVVLKGARTLVCDGTADATGADRHCSINPTGGPSLATGGTGDVLAGTIGALLAQGLSAVDAARAGVYVHGAAGDELASRHGARGVMSSDLPEAVAAAIHALSRAR
jgi:hydroxyethylthiazole kinase-like uncharacterized protein yjeF